MLYSPTTPLGEPATTASTRGWDTVYAIRFADVNGAIARAGSSPDAFQYREGSTAGTGIEGEFGDWRLTGGSGRLVQLTLPVPAMFIREYDASGQVANVVERRHVDIVITLQLSALPQPDTPPGAGGGTVHELRVHLPNIAGPFGASVVTVDDVIYPAMSGAHTQPASDADPVNREVVRLLFADWINTVENLQGFNHAFCAVNLNAKATEGQFQWLMPVHMSYAVSQGPTPDTGIFAVLCMTGAPGDQRPIPESQDISPNAIPTGTNSAFLISKERFLSKLVMPGLSSQFAAPQDEAPDPATGEVPHWPQEYFEVAASGNMIRNSRPITIPNFQGRDQDDPSVARIGRNGLNLVMEDTYLDVRYEGLTHPFWWFWYEAIHNITVHVHAGLNPQGRFILTPPPEGTDDDLTEHTAVLVKTPAGQTIDNILIALDILAILVPVAKLGWGKFISGGAKVVGDGGSAAGKISKAGAEAAMEAGVKTITAGAKAGSAVKASGFFARNFSRIYTGITALLFVGLTAEKIIQIIGNDNDWAKGRIPEFKEFASRVMAPVTWPASTDFQVTSVRFNGSFQVGGEALFPAETHKEVSEHA